MHVSSMGSIKGSRVRFGDITIQVDPAMVNGSAIPPTPNDHKRRKPYVTVKNTLAGMFGVKTEHINYSPQKGVFTVPHTLDSTVNVDIPDEDGIKYVDIFPPAFTKAGIPFKP